MANVCVLEGEIRVLSGAQVVEKFTKREFSRTDRYCFQYRPRRSHSLDALPPPETVSTDRTRSPSPAPSSGLESTSVKDSPIQLDVLTSDTSVTEVSGEHRGVICGGTVRGWLPDVAVILWKRMLGALGEDFSVNFKNILSSILLVFYICLFSLSCASSRNFKTAVIEIFTNILSDRQFKSKL